LGKSLTQYSFTQIDNMVDQIYCDFFDGRAPNITNDLVEQLLQMQYQYRLLFRYTQPVVKLAFVGFVREITKYFGLVLVDDATSRNEDMRLKFVFYSAHDTDLALFSAGLQIPLTTMPHFASTMFYELHSNESANSSDPNNNYYVRVIYNDADIDFTQQCGSQYCTLLQFNQLMQSAIFQGDLQKECHSPVTKAKLRGDKFTAPLKAAQFLLSTEESESLETAVDSTSGSFRIAIGFIITVVLFVTVLVIFIVRNKRRALVNERIMCGRVELNEELTKITKKHSISLLEVEI